MAWKGNPNNLVPNFVQQPKVEQSEKTVVINRAEETRRDTDKQKDFTIGLMDIDTVILNQLEKFQLMVVDNGQNIKVPTYYANPERWKSIQKDGCFRDYNGKIVLPCMVFKRISSEKDQALMAFNRFLNYTVIKKYSEKNRYTPFSVLIGQNVPVNDVYDVKIPDHVILTYQFIIWAEKNEQINKLVERLNFESEDYWGEANGLRFRTELPNFNHTIELSVEQDRMVKTEFELRVHGYLLPDIIQTMQGRKNTTQKRFTPKKVIMGAETVATNFDWSDQDQNREKWRNQNYPNLQKDVPIPAPPVVLRDTITINENLPVGVVPIPIPIQPTSNWDTEAAYWETVQDNWE